MKRLYLLFALLMVPWFASAADAPFLPGKVYVATAACNLPASWWSDCLTPTQPVWKDFTSVTANELVAVCATDENSPTECFQRGNNRAWMRKSDITTAVPIRTCIGEYDSNGDCLVSNYVKLTTTTPPVDPPPPVPSLKPTFVNVTDTLLDRARPTTYNFGTLSNDMNGDGCKDLFLATHSDATPSYLWLQTRTAGRCMGKFVMQNMPTDNTGWTQPAPSAPRITSRYNSLNLQNNESGIPCFYGMDVDGGNAALYCPAPDMQKGSMTMKYAPKTAGCMATMSCTVIDVDGDGVIEFFTNTRTNTNFQPAIRNVASTDTKYALPTATVDGQPAAAGSIEGTVVFDVNNDGWPEVVNPGLRGYWSFNQSTKAMVWNAAKFTGATHWRALGSSHCAVFDYDSDGDADLYCGAGTGSGTADQNIFTPYLYKNNNGSFEEVSVAAKIVGLKNTFYHTTYSNTEASDLNLDGYPDLVMSSESFGNTLAAATTTLIMNNGDGTFTVDRSNNFGSITGPNSISAKGWVSVTDVTNDGLPDIVRVHGRSGTANDTDGKPLHEGLALFRNTTVTTNKWLSVEVQSKTKDGLHATVTLMDPGSNRIIGSSQIGGFSHGYQAYRAEFGVGQRSKVKVVVRMPHGGATYTFDNVDVNQQMTVSATGVATYRAADKALVEN